MQQPSVINTVDSTPHPAATHTRESSVSFNLNYVTSPPGIFKLLEFVFGLICWALIASSYLRISQHEFALAITVMAWISTIFTLLIFTLGCHSGVCSGMPCLVIEFCLNLLWSLFYFIASCVLAATAGGAQNLIAAAVFGFFTSLLYIGHTLISFKEWRGSYPWN